MYFTRSIYGSEQDFDPTKLKLRLVDDKVHSTFLKIKHDKSSKATLKYSLACKNGNCLISDYEDEFADSFKTESARYIKE